MPVSFSPIQSRNSFALVSFTFTSRSPLLLLCLRAVVAVTVVGVSIVPRSFSRNFPSVCFFHFRSQQQLTHSLHILWSLTSHHKHLLICIEHNFCDHLGKGEPPGVQFEYHFTGTGAGEVRSSFTLTLTFTFINHLWSRPTSSIANSSDCIKFSQIFQLTLNQFPSQPDTYASRLTSRVPLLGGLVALIFLFFR